MANLDRFRFETETDRNTFLSRHGYKTSKSCLVNVNISEDNNAEKPYIVDCIRENVFIITKNDKLIK